MDDCTRAIVLALERYDDGDPVNVGSGDEISIGDLAGRVAAATGFRGEIRWDPTKPNGQPRRRLDVSRARDQFGFEAKISLEAGLAETVRWYRQSSGRRECWLEP